MASGAPLPLLFINKGRQSWSRSNSKDESSVQTEIRRHVQQSLRGRRIRRQKPIHTSTKDLVGWRTVPISPTVFASSNDANSVHESEVVTELSRSNPPASCTSPPPERQQWLMESHLPLSRTIDSLNCISGSFDDGKFRTLQYCLYEWMGSSDPARPSTQSLRQIFGFSPVARLDRGLVHMIISSALCASDELHMNALLSVAGNRMQFVSKIRPSLPYQTPLYTVKAIQAVRKWVAEGLPASDRLLQAIGYLVFGETYARNRNTLRVYWELIRKLIIDCGGLQALTPYTAWMLLAADHLRHQIMVQSPALDFRKYPQLLGIKRPEMIDDHQLEAMIQAALAQTGPRVQAYGNVILNFSDVMSYICRLPQSVIENVRIYVSQHIQFPHRPYFAPLQQTSGLQAEPDEQDQREYIADISYFHAKCTSCNMWLWHVAVSFLDGGMSAAMSSSAARTTSKATAEIEECILSAEAMLLHSAWKMPNASLLWILGLLVLVNDSFLSASLETTTRFVQVANRMDVVSEEQLKTTLNDHLPLERVRANAYEMLAQVLWTANMMQMKNDDTPDAVTFPRIGLLGNLPQFLNRATAVLMQEMFYNAKHSSTPQSVVTSVINAVQWLKALGQEDKSALRAWTTCYNILNKASEPTASAEQTT